MPFGQRQSREQQVVRLKAEIHLLHGNETPHHQPGAGEQNQRQRHLHHHQRIAQAAPAKAAADALAGVLERLHQVLPRRLQRRREAEKQRRNDRHAEAEQQDGNIQLDHRFPWDHAGRDQGDDTLKARIGEQAPQRGSGQRQQQALGKQLPDQFGAPGINELRIAISFHVP